MSLAIIRYATVNGMKKEVRRADELRLRSVSITFLGKGKVRLVYETEEDVLLRL